MSRLTIKNLTKIYNPGKNEVHAVKDFNLEIEDGEFVALLGPSGCGKTSTLRMIVGLESITSGSILFDDVEINHLSPEQRNVAMAFESYALYPNFTIFENLAFPLEVKKNSSSEISKKVGDIAKMLQKHPHYPEKQLYLFHSFLNQLLIECIEVLYPNDNCLFFSP